MTDVRAHLKRWMEAGLIDRETAGRIEVWEHGQKAQQREEELERPGALEALLYLGIVVLAVGVFALLAQNWDELESWARVASVGVPVALLLGAGAVMRASKEPELERGSQAAWLVATGLFAGLLAVVFNEYWGGFEDERGPLLIIAGSTFALAVWLWVVSPRHAQVLAIAGAGFFLGQAVGTWPDEFSQALAGMTILALGLAGAALAEAGWFTPVPSARLFFSVLCIAGPFEAGAGDGHILFELLAGAMAAAVIAYGVWRGSFLLVLVGVAGSFVILVSFIFEHFSEQLGAPLALMISGGVMVAAVLLLATYRREIQARRQPA